MKLNLMDAFTLFSRRFGGGQVFWDLRHLRTVRRDGEGSPLVSFKNSGNTSKEFCSQWGTIKCHVYLVTILVTFASQRERDELLVILPVWSLWSQPVRRNHCRGINYHPLFRHPNLFYMISCYTSSSCCSSWISIFLDCWQCLPARIAKLSDSKNILNATWSCDICANATYTLMIYDDVYVICYLLWAFLFVLSFFKCTWSFFSQMYFKRFVLFCRLGTNQRTRPSQETNLSKFYYQLHQLVNYVVR